MNQVMNYTRMAGVLWENFFKYGGSVHVSSKVTPFFRRTENRQSVERRAIHIIGKFAMNFGHDGFKVAVPFFFRSFAEQDFDTAQVELLALRGSFCKPRFRSWRKAFENFARGAYIFFMPYGMALRHCLAPIRH